LNPDKALSAVEIVKKFGGLSVLDGIDVAIRDGEIVGLIGPNGAGKTTFFNIVTGFLKPDSGSFEYYGTPATGLLPFQIAKLRVSRTFQIVKPFPTLTVKEAAMIGAYRNTNKSEAAEDMAIRALKLVAMDGLEERRCDSCNLMQTKLVDLARCIATNPRIILIDELAAGVTPSEFEELADVLIDINKRGITMCVVEHVFRFISKVCSRILVLNDGKIIAEGSPEQIANDPKVLTAYLGEYR